MTLVIMNCEVTDVPIVYNAATTRWEGAEEQTRLLPETGIMTVRRSALEVMAEAFVSTVKKEVDEDNR